MLLDWYYVLGILRWRLVITQQQQKKHYFKAMPHKYVEKATLMKSKILASI